MTMKKLLLFFAAVCLVATAAIAQPVQLQKGKMMAGVTSTISLCGSWGSELMGLSFSSVKYKYGSDPAEEWYKKTAFNILPKGGYFIMDNLVAGLEIILTGERDKDTDDGDVYMESMLGAGPFVRYYYPLEKIYPFAEAEFVIGTYRTGWDGDTHNEGMSMLGIGVGAAYPLGEKVTFDAVIGWSRACWRHEGEVGVEREIHGGFGLKMGFSVYL
jgi:hypothetical protein